MQLEPNQRQIQHAGTALEIGAPGALGPQTAAVISERRTGWGFPTLLSRAAWEEELREHVPARAHRRAQPGRGW